MAAALAGGVAAAIGSFAIAMRSHALWLVVVPLGVIVPLGAVFFSRWRSPPKEAIERFASQIRTARKAGTRTAALSRGAVAGIAVLAFVFSLGVVHSSRAGAGRAVATSAAPKLRAACAEHEPPQPLRG